LSDRLERMPVRQAVDVGGGSGYNGRGGVWRSLVARLLWEQEVASSNLAAPIATDDVMG
jgi:hypothetical protein